jgi:hypothetical protein
MTSKADFLKRYLEPVDPTASSDYLVPTKKKKKKAKTTKAGGMKIIDSDADAQVRPDFDKQDEEGTLHFLSKQKIQK